MCNRSYSSPEFKHYSSLFEKLVLKRWFFAVARCKERQGYVTIRQARQILGIAAHLNRDESAEVLSLWKELGLIKMVRCHGIKILRIPSLESQEILRKSNMEEEDD